MSFFKALLLAIFATLFLTYALGTSLLELLDIQIYMNDHIVEPLQAITISALVMLIMLIVAIAIVLSVFGGIIFICVLVIGAIAMAFIGIFWPIILAAMAIWLLARDKQPTHKKINSHLS
jgi:hypothetical protein